MDTELLRIQARLCEVGNQVFDSSGFLDLRYNGYVFWTSKFEMHKVDIVGARLERTFPRKWRLRFRIGGTSWVKSTTFVSSPDEEQLLKACHEMVAARTGYLMKRGRG